MIQTARNDAPKHLQTAGMRLWAETLRDFKLHRRHEMELLQRACEQADRLDEIRGALAEQGLTVVDSKGNVKPNPFLVEERACGNSIRLLIRDLALGAKTATENRLPRTKLYNPNAS